MNEKKHGFRIGVTAKILSILALCLLGLISLSWLVLRDARRDYTEAHAQELRNLVGTVTSHVAALAADVDAGRMTLAEAQAKALAEISRMRYGNGEYFWVNDMTPRMLMHPIKPEMNGTDLSAKRDPEGKALFVEMVKVVAQDGAGMVSYMWPKPGMDAPQPKLSYV